MPILKLQDYNEAIKTLLSTHDLPLFRAVDACEDKDVPERVFSAVDNDLLAKSEVIRQYVLDKGLIPVIAEAALGTYLITTHHKANKKSILRDCLPLIKMCDHFWIFVDSPETTLKEIVNKLPEGVLFELMYWFEITKKTVRIINIFNFSDPSIFYFSMSDLHLISNKSFKDEVFLALEEQKKNLNKTVYIATARQHTKQLDWLRKKIFHDGGVPVCAHNLIPEGSMLLSFGEDKKRMMLLRVSLALKCDEVCVYGSFHSNKVTFENIDIEILFEMYLLLKLAPNKKIAYQSFYQSEVPKYKNPKWGITEEERIETLRAQGAHHRNVPQYGIFYSLPARLPRALSRAEVEDNKGFLTSKL